jgi:hypothetical protein
MLTPRHIPHVLQAPTQLVPLSCSFARATNHHAKTQISKRLPMLPLSDAVRKKGLYLGGEW